MAETKWKLGPSDIKFVPALLPWMVLPHQHVEFGANKLSWVLLADARNSILELASCL